MTAATKRLILNALSRVRGDDFERATAAFKHCTPKQMQQEYGASGETRQAILDGYREHVEKVEAAIREVEAL